MFIISPVSALLVLLLSVLLLFGVKNSSLFNVVCTCINLVILLFFIVFGAVYVVPSYWTEAASNATVYLNSSALGCNGTLAQAAQIPFPGGFAPFGIGGILKVD